MLFDKVYLNSLFRLFFINLKQNIQKEQSYGILFSLITLSTAIGVCTYFTINFTINFVDIVYSIVMTTILLIYSQKYIIINVILLLLLAFILGIFFAHLEDWRYNTKMLGGIVGTTITAKLLEPPQFKNNRYHLLLYIENTEKPHLTFLPKIVKLSARDIPQNLKTNDIIKAYARLCGMSGPTRVNGYDFAFYNYFKSIGATGYFLGKITYISHNDNLSIWQKLRNNIQNLRTIINERIKQHQNNEEGAIASALITGDKSLISEDTNNALRRAGLAHILAISGLHMSIVTGLAFLSIRYFLSLFMCFGCYFSIKKIAALFAIIIACFYFILSGGTPSAQRSFIMIEIIFLAILFDKSAITIRNLLIAVWAVIIIYPHQILDPSFQMSFGAAAALISLYKTYSNDSKFLFNKTTIGLVKPTKFWQISENMYDRLVYFIINTAFSSFVAGTASSIFAIYHFSNFAPYAVISNVLAGSVISFLVMPFALIAVLAMPFNLENLPLKILTQSIMWVKEIAFYIANLTPDIPIKIMNNFSFAWLCFGFCLLIIFRTKLRLIGIIPIIIGAIIYYNQNLPIALIAENGKMAMILLSNHSAILYGKHPSNFILDEWKKSYLIKKIIKPNDIVTKSKFYNITSFSELQCALKENVKHKIIFVNYYNYINLKSTNNVTYIFKKQLELNGMVEIYNNNKLKWAVPTLQHSWVNYRKYNAERF